MTSKSVVSTMSICSNSELKAMSKLVQMVANATQYEKITMEDWKIYCMAAFGWDAETAAHITNQTRRLANRVLEDAKLEL